MMQPKFDEADLALIETAYPRDGTQACHLIGDLIEEVRRYQDLLAAAETEIGELESKLEHIEERRDDYQ
jgi:hypothetical protein